MNAKELLAAYSDCDLAVAWCELHLCPLPDDPDDMFAELMAAGVGPDEALPMIRTVIQDAIDEGDPGRHAEALAQTQHPSFRTYVAAKLGAF